MMEVSRLDSPANSSNSPYTLTLPSKPTLDHSSIASMAHLDFSNRLPSNGILGKIGGVESGVFVKSSGIVNKNPAVTILNHHHLGSASEFYLPRSSLNSCSSERQTTNGPIDIHHEMMHSGMSRNNSSTSSNSVSPTDQLSDKDDDLIECGDCGGEFNNLSLYMDHKCSKCLTSARPSEISEKTGSNNTQFVGNRQANCELGSSSDDELSDVESFDGRIVYNPDGSAYIIEGGADSNLGEPESLLALPEGCIVDKRGLEVSDKHTLPQIANAVFLPKNALSHFHNLLISPLENHTPTMHSYKVFNVRGAVMSGCDENENSKSEDDANGSLNEFASTVPTKPILMCFICKLSFGFSKSFVAHAISEHLLSLNVRENELMSQRNTSAIIQGVGKNKNPLLSFLKPNFSHCKTTESKKSQSMQLTSSKLSICSSTLSEDNTNVSFVYNKPNVSDSIKTGGAKSYVANDRCSITDGAKELNLNLRHSLTKDVILSSQDSKNSVLDLKASQSLEHSLNSIVNNYYTSSHRSNVSNSINAHNNLNNNHSSIPLIKSEDSDNKPVRIDLNLSIPPSLAESIVESANHIQAHSFFGACDEHPHGRTHGVDCPKCDLLLSSSRSLGGHMTMMHSRNSCKTLKCPKCNWHYKYQETLEIHMKEKHPDNDTQCVYCIAAQPHPRLARGESYTCGYKPYRCEVCNYSTTTKGNLSIHMQSDKHLNNMQELANGGDLSKIAASQQASQQAYNVPPPPPPITTAANIPASSSPSTIPPSAVDTDLQKKNKPKPTWRCDVCNYETNVARNLRIHMTSEKHTHNMLVLQQNMKHMHRDMHMQIGGAPLGMFAAHQDSSSVAAVTTAALLGLPAAFPGPPPGLPFSYDMFLAAGLQPGLGLNHLPLTLPKEQLESLSFMNSAGTGSFVSTNFEAMKLFQCCVCNVFFSDSIEGLHQHMQLDRTKHREHENIAVSNGTYLCNLCTYKTNLKANFQLHCKTDKHLQRLQQVNHIKEGGGPNEWRLKYLNVNNPVQVRCTACDYFTNSIHKLQIHTADQCHEVNSRLYHHLQISETRLSSASSEPKKVFYECVLCQFRTRTKLGLIMHIRTVRHLQCEGVMQARLCEHGKAEDLDMRDVFTVHKYTNDDDIKFDDEDVDQDEQNSPRDHSNDQQPVSFHSPPPSSSALSSSPSSALAMPAASLANRSMSQEVQRETTTPSRSASSAETAKVSSVFASADKSTMERVVVTMGASNENSDSVVESADEMSGNDNSDDSNNHNDITDDDGYVNKSNLDNNLPLCLTVNEEKVATSPETLSSNPRIICPLCHESFKQKLSLENHLIEVHNVKSEGIHRLLVMVDQSEWASTPQATTDSTTVKAESERGDNCVADQDAQDSEINDNDRQGQSSSPDETGITMGINTGVTTMKLPLIVTPPVDTGDDIDMDTIEEAARIAAEDSVDMSNLSEKNNQLDDYQYRCQTCAKTFSNIDMLYAHQNELGHLELKQTPRGPGYLCWKKGCNQYFKTAQSLQVHFREIHAKRQASTNSSIAVLSHDEIASIYIHKCSHCTLAFKSIDKLKIHTQYHLIKTATTCSQCRQSFRSITALNQHIKSMHPELHKLSSESLEHSVLLEDTGSNLNNSNSALILGKENGDHINGDLFLNVTHTLDDLKNEGMMLDNTDGKTVLDANDNKTMDHLIKRESQIESANSDMSNDSVDSKYRDHQFMDDYVNSQAMAEGSYEDPSRKYKCHRCKVAFTKQSYLTAHNKTLLHRRGDKFSYTMEKYMDPNRPFKCDECRESFTQKNILLVHYNSVSHLHKVKQTTQQVISGATIASSPGKVSQPSVNASSAISPPMTLSATTSPAVPTTRPSPSLTPVKIAPAPAPSQNINNNNVAVSSGLDSDKKPYKCNICKVSYSQGSTLDIHVRSVYHQTRASKLQDLAMTGQVDLSQPLIEKLEIHGQKSHSIHTQQQKLANDLTMPSKQQQSVRTTAAATAAAAAAVRAATATASVSQTPLLLQGFAGSGLSTIPGLAHLQLSLPGTFLPQVSPDMSQAFTNQLFATSASTTVMSPSLSLQSHKGSQRISTVPISAIHSTSNSHSQHSDLKINIFEEKAKEKLQETVRKYMNSVANKESSTTTKERENEIVKTEPFDTDNMALIQAGDLALPMLQPIFRARNYLGRFKPHMQRTLLENIGFDCVMHFNELNQLRKPDKTKDNSDSSKEIPTNDNDKEDEHEKELVDDKRDMWDDLPEINKCVCCLCDKEFSSVWILKTHEEDFHKTLVPIQAVEDLGTEFREDYDKRRPKETTHPESTQQPSETSFSQLAAGGAESVLGMGTATSSETIVTSEPVLSGAHTTLDLSQLPLPMFNMIPMNMGLNVPMSMNMHPPLIPMFVPSGLDAASFQQALPTMLDANSLVSQQKHLQLQLQLQQQQQQQLQQQQQQQQQQQLQQQQQQAAAIAASNQKRARTRINDDQLKILRAHFDINNSPSEEQIITMSEQSGLPQKVIKHWFRNTLFKERQRNKDSPYNFNNPPSTTLNLEEYEKTGKILDKPKESSSECSEKPVSPTPTIIQPIPVTIKKERATPEPTPVVCQLVAPPPPLVQIPSSVLTPISVTTSPIFTVSNSPTTICMMSPQMNGRDDDMASRSPTYSMGKRANRTRFSDFQIHMLQEYFEQNAYPKDDDLDHLSKMLNLNPRVIVVWFQNARQKARKSYENQPRGDSVEPSSSSSHSTYPCSRCNAVFPTHYELIRHQKNRCVAEDDSGTTNALSLSVASSLDHSVAEDDDSSSTTVSQDDLNMSDTFMSSTAASDITRIIAHEKDKLQEIAEQRLYQCDKCSLHFPHFEQWREHQNVHMMNPALFPPFPHGESAFAMLQSVAQQHENKTSPLKRRIEEEIDDYDEMQKDKRLRTTILPEQLDYLYQKYQLDNSPSRKQLETIAHDVQLKKRVVQVWFQNTRARERKGQYRVCQQFIHKRCPFCRALFRAKAALESHLATKHPEQMAKGEINVDDIPNEESDDIPSMPHTPLSNSPSPSPQNLDFTKLLSPMGMQSFLPFMPGAAMPLGFPGPADPLQQMSMKHIYEDSLKKYMDELATVSHMQSLPQMTSVDLSTKHQHEAHVSPVKVPKLTTTPISSNDTNDEAPLDLSKPVKVKVEREDSSSDNDRMSVNDILTSRRTSFEMAGLDPESGNEDDKKISLSPGESTYSISSQCGKRYRTQMTNLQIRIMKNLFIDYKTPSMSECEMLGHQIGLPKRVVQVWFQNARAKEKKSLSYQGSYSSDVDFARPPAECKQCNFKYSHTYTIQDHIFTKKHIGNVRRMLQAQGDIDQDINEQHDNLPFLLPKPHMELDPLSAREKGLPRSSSADLNAATAAAANSAQLAQLQAMGLGALGLTGLPGSTATLDLKKELSTDSQTRDEDGDHKSRSVGARTPSSSSSISAAMPSDAMLQHLQMMSPYGNFMPGLDPNLLPYMYSGAMPGFYPGLGMPMMQPTYVPGADQMFAFDPLTFGTPLPLLQIPHQAIKNVSVKLSDPSSTLAQYTQDCKVLGDLKTEISGSDFKLFRETFVHVGYICKKCHMVYPEKDACLSHQRSMCFIGKIPDNIKTILKLEQVQYECLACGDKSSTHQELKGHCQLVNHRVKASKYQFPSSSSSSSSSSHHHRHHHHHHRSSSSGGSSHNPASSHWKPSPSPVAIATDSKPVVVQSPGKSAMRMVDESSDHSSHGSNAIDSKSVIAGAFEMLTKIKDEPTSEDGPSQKKPRLE